MCGILSILRSPVEPTVLRKKALGLSKLIRHRGPDWNGIHVQQISDKLIHLLAHERLAIVNPQSGHQPLFDDTKNICVTVNGEIYNYKDLMEKIDCKTVKSDCGVIPYLYKKYGHTFLSMLDGMFAFVLTDSSTGDYLIARDPYGICPLYIGYAEDKSIYVCSELKGLIKDTLVIEEFPPGCYLTSNNSQFQRYHSPDWWTQDISHITFLPFAQDLLYSKMSRAVEKRLMSDVPFAVMLSGGLDSSIVAYLTCKFLKERTKREETQSSLIHPQLHTFSIGMEGSPDTEAALSVANYLETVHHSFQFDLQEGLDALTDVIYHLETYDVTTIRASTPMYFLCRLIKSMGIKMVLSGEGSDEIFGGYLYFRRAPNSEEFYKETVEKVRLLHYYDLLRANKSSMAFGVEIRVPFMDKELVDLAMHIHPQEKMHTQQRIEKWLLRKTFEKHLPHHIVWRQKEQFSDGVGYGWIDGLKDYANTHVSDQLFSHRHTTFPYNTPTTKEAYYYRHIFNTLFPHNSADKLVHGGPSIACSTPAAIQWDASFKNNADQSGRAVIGVHAQSKKFTDSVETQNGSN